MTPSDQSDSGFVSFLVLAAGVAVAVCGAIVASDVAAALGAEGATHTAATVLGAAAGAKLL